MGKQQIPHDIIMKQIDRLDAFSEFLQVLDQYPEERIEINPHAYAMIGKMMEESIVKIVAEISECKIVRIKGR